MEANPFLFSIWTWKHNNKSDVLALDLRCRTKLREKKGWWIIYSTVIYKSWQIQLSRSLLVGAIIEIKLSISILLFSVLALIPYKGRTLTMSQTFWLPMLLLLKWWIHWTIYIIKQNTLFVFTSVPWFSWVLFCFFSHHRNICSWPPIFEGIQIDMYINFWLRTWSFLSS
jgi:hypothetical protein